MCCASDSDRRPQRYDAFTVPAGVRAWQGSCECRSPWLSCGADAALLPQREERPPAAVAPVLQHLELELEGDLLGAW